MGGDIFSQKSTLNIVRIIPIIVWDLPVPKKLTDRMRMKF